MTRNLNLTSSPEQGASNRGQRLAGEEIEGALTPRVERPTRAHSSGAYKAHIAPGAGPIEATPEVRLNQLRAKDQLLIQTRHGTYVFLVTDPAKQIGLVVGGVFGDYAAHAVLEVFPAAHDRRLSAGARARFYIEASGGFKRVTTSVINYIVHRKTGAE